uniref:Uncharacterized protein n=1 Tax=Physcomitrium patens TaxID=3218 RepID=A0A2K1JXG4_PHYPA|nr:hypothetical protein PHYPA_013339 [Physcomitrium patens]
MGSLLAKERGCTTEEEEEDNIIEGQTELGDESIPNGEADLFPPRELDADEQAAMEEWEQPSIGIGFLLNAYWEC